MKSFFFSKICAMIVLHVSISVEYLPHIYSLNCKHFLFIRLRRSAIILQVSYRSGMRYTVKLKKLKMERNISTFHVLSYSKVCEHDTFVITT